MGAQTLIVTVSVTQQKPVQKTGTPLDDIMLGMVFSDEAAVAGQAMLNVFRAKGLATANRRQVGAFD